VHLDRFRAINDLLGFAAGDLVLQVATSRLSDLWPNDSRVHRLGGNVFALLVTGLPAYDSNTLYRQVFQALEGEPFTLADQHIDLTVTLGIVRFPVHGEQAGLLLRNAEVALYAAKQAHKPWSEYNAEQVGSRREQLSLLGELRRAIEQHEMHVFYQPQVSINRGQLVQAEALVRWRHPERGWVPPSAFIPFAEQTGRIRSLTDWLLNQVAEQVAAWRASGHPLTVSINVAIHDLEDPDFPRRVAAALRRHDAQAIDLCLEITEGGLMADPEQARTTLDTLHEAGHRLAIDDFGTGYSSLAYLSHLPVNELKIDRSFIMDLNLHNRSIVLSTISLGHALGLKVVAEGVETATQYRELALLGCDVAQGYLIARALPLEEFNTWRVTHGGECDWSSQPDAQPALGTASAPPLLGG
jgi:diguanylate cyclase (GGDEF)-like protein